MEIKETNLQSTYNTADDNGKHMLRALFPDVIFLNNGNKQKLPITERIKTFNDACYELGEEHPLVKDYNLMSRTESPNLKAYLKLRIICAALNENEELEIGDDNVYYPWFYFYTQSEIDAMDELEKQERHFIDISEYKMQYAAYCYAGINSFYSDTAYNLNFSLCLKNGELAEYCGNQFIRFWADLNLIRR